MKGLGFVSIVAGLAVMSVFSSCSEEKTAKCTSSDAAIEAVMTRTSVREFTAQKVGKDTVEILLRAAMAAPTAWNSQPWAFVVLDDEALLDSLAVMSGNNVCDRAPLAIVACGDTAKMIDGDARAYWINDVSAASENILIAANALGLGAVWTGGYPDSGREAGIRKALNLPANLIPMSVLCIGYPAKKQKPQNKWKEENIYYNRFEPEK